MTISWDEYSFFYTDHIEVPLPAGHRFPMTKYRLLRDELVRLNILQPGQLSPSPAVAMEDLLRVHDKEYVSGIKNNTLDVKAARPIGLPVTEGLYQRSLAAVGGFVESSLSALKFGFSAQLAGGTHHAFADHGEGFCVFNDFAVAALKLIDEGRASKILILDLDVHQGNGTSSILGKRSDVFVASLHGERNYPFRKIPSHLDVPLPAGTGDDDYLSALSRVLLMMNDHHFDMIFYQAGVDVLEYDSLGTFKLSFEGIQKRDRMVFEFARRSKIPLAMGIGGGYSIPIEHTVKAHVGTFEMAREVFSR